MSNLRAPTVTRSIARPPFALLLPFNVEKLFFHGCDLVVYSSKPPSENGNISQAPRHGGAKVFL